MEKAVRTSCRGRITAVALLLVCGTFSWSAVDDHAAAQETPCVAKTSGGDVLGVRRGGACAYLGVPYATAPIGNLRWRPPQPRAPWAPATLNATAVPPICAQINLAGANAGNEDCLTLNIWTPAARSPGRGTSVVVWLHTGGFQAASSNFPSSDGQRFADQRGAIVVAPNYRLGPFGFLSHDAFASEDRGHPTTGNYGLADQRAALRWVRDNIAGFGGDPDNVTLAGTSAGATSTSLHLISPASRGLFHRAVLQSAYPTARWPTVREGYLQGEAFAAALGCTDRARTADCLRAASPDQVLRALPLGQYQIVEDSSRTIWGPVVDGLEIPDQPRELYRRGQFVRVPVVVGVNGDEGWTFVDRSFPSGLDAFQYESVIRSEFGMDASSVLALYPAHAFTTPKDALARVTADVEFVCEARRVARVMHHDGAPVYVYSFEYPLDGATAGRALHGLESNFLFGNNFAVNPGLGINAARPLNAADVGIYDTMSTFWRRFMETGDPNPPGQPAPWPPYRPGPFDPPVDASDSDRHFIFADRVGVGNHLRDQQCNFWESFYFRSALGSVPAAAR